MMRRVLALLVLSILAAGVAPVLAAGQETPDERPENLPYFYDAAGMFPEDQRNTLARDAQLLQSTGIPTLVYVREASAAQAAIEESQDFADQLRTDWGVESEEGADDGLVLLVSWVPNTPQASTAVFSYGAATFENSGLTPEAIQETIDTSVASLIDQGKPFETLVYLMRETRYTGIYSPPPPPAIEGMARTIHESLDWVTPVAVIAVTLLLASRSIAFWRTGPVSREIWSVTGGVLAAVLVMWMAAVYAQSRTGVAGALIILALLALACWLWTHTPFTTRHATLARRRSVPPTRRLMRQRHQLRQMFARATGAGR